MQSQKPMQVIAIVASGDVFRLVQPFLTRSNLAVRRARSAPTGLSIVDAEPPDLVMAQYPLAGLAPREFFQHFYGPERAAGDPPLLVLTREDRLEEVMESVQGRKARACCMESAEDRDFHLALHELVDVAARCSGRLLFTAEVDFGESSVQRVLQTVNISKSGAFLRMRRPLRVGTILPFRMQLPEARPEIRGIGEVVRHGDSETGEPTGIGFRFLDLEEGADDRLSRFVASLRLEQDSARAPAPPGPR